METPILSSASGFGIQKVEQVSTFSRAELHPAFEKFGANGVLLKSIETKSGTLSYVQNKHFNPENPSIVFLHGNSASKEAFAKQFGCETLDRAFNLFAFDLPGHSQSEDAKDPKTYSFKGYAEVITEAIETLGLENVLICGWSLGGHIAIEMMDSNRIKGSIITGTPPLKPGPEGLAEGFHMSNDPALKLLGHPDPFSDEEAIVFAKGGGFDDEGATLFQDILKRTHGTARQNMIASAVDGSGSSNQYKLVLETKKPIHMIICTEDQGVNGDYIQKVTTKANNELLTTSRISARHAAFWTSSVDFNEMLYSTALKM